jgi:hypothetical protein
VTVEPLARPWSGPMRAPLLWAAGALAAAALLHVRDPHVSGSYGFCPWNLLTGGYCPGCGGLRAVHDLTHADLAGAASSNLLVVAALPLAALGWAAWSLARWRGERLPGALGNRPALAVAVVLVAAFTVLRNLPAGGWLAP